jgi:FdhD protein
MSVASSRTLRGPTHGDGARPFEVLRVDHGDAVARLDVAAAEEPLELRLQGTSFFVTMRTPGADAELAAGFLLSERIIEKASDILSIRHCADTPDADNVLNVMLSGSAADALEWRLAERRQVTATSACGVCGRRSIDDLMQAIKPVRSTLRVPATLIGSLPERLRAAQRVFDATGGLHAAALFDADGTLIVAAEDVGRHNAVDKVIGSQLLHERMPLHDMLLFVSGRTSFEIVQKAVVAGIPIVAAVSAPSSLAIELARDSRVTLIGFVREGTFNIYAGRDRIQL